MLVAVGRQGYQPQSLPWLRRRPPAFLLPPVACLPIVACRVVVVLWLLPVNRVVETADMCFAGAVANIGCAAVVLVESAGIAAAVVPEVVPDAAAVAFEVE